MRNNWLVAFATLAAIYPLAASARDVVVTLNAKAGPWLTSLNKKMPYGVGDQGPATVVPFDVASGSIGVFGEGTTLVDGRPVGPAGFDDDEVDDMLVKGRRYPSFYAPKVLYPARRHGLIAIFVDAAGVAVSRPLMVGKRGIALPIPDNAAGIALGFNDVSFAGNSGTLTDTVQIPD